MSQNTNNKTYGLRAPEEKLAHVAKIKGDLQQVQNGLAGHQQRLIALQNQHDALYDEHAKIVNKEATYYDFVSDNKSQIWEIKEFENVKIANWHCQQLQEIVSGQSARQIADSYDTIKTKLLADKQNVSAEIDHTKKLISMSNQSITDMSHQLTIIQQKEN